MRIEGEKIVTLEELDAAIAELIIPQEKAKSTGNSHKRKQWENRRNWRRCTVGQTCKLGGLKDYEELYKFYDRFPEFTGWLTFPESLDTGGLSHMNYDEDKHHFTWYSYHSKYHRKTAARHVRKYKGEISNGSMYRKIYDYVYACY